MNFAVGESFWLLNNNLILVDTSSQNPFCVMPAHGSRYNIVHAGAVRNLCVYLNDQKLVKDITSVGVTTPYKAQQIFINDLVAIGILDIDNSRDKSPLSISIASDASHILCKLLILSLLSILLVTFILLERFFSCSTASFDLQKDINISFP